MYNKNSFSDLHRIPANENNRYFKKFLNVNFYFRNYVSDNEIQLCSFL